MRKFKTKQILIVIGVLLSPMCTLHAAGMPEPVARARKPNILFLFADDQRADTIAALGNPHIKTPNLDRLVNAGFSFKGNYIFGGNSGAVCVPSRAMLMTGKTWFHVDTESLKDAKLLPELLQEHGYVTFATGKWHNGQSSWLRAFQLGKNVMFGGMSDHTKVPVRDLGLDGKLTAERIGEKFSSELFADSAIEFLEHHDGKKPFFAYVAFTAPHDPRQPPLPYREMYYRDLPPLPANFLPQLPFDNGMMNGGRDENLAPWPRTEAVIRDQLAEYYGLITHMDEQVGRILAALRKSGQAEDTLIVYAADNGLALGSHGLLGKQSVFEHSMRVPLIIAGPGIPGGKSTEAFTYLLDIFPTLCDTVGIPRPAGLEGESLRPLWEGKQDRVRDSVFLPLSPVPARDPRSTMEADLLSEDRLHAVVRPADRSLRDHQPDRHCGIPAACPAVAHTHETVAGQGRRYRGITNSQQAAQARRPDRSGAHCRSMATRVDRAEVLRPGH